VPVPGRPKDIDVAIVVDIRSIDRLSPEEVTVDDVHGPRFPSAVGVLPPGDIVGNCILGGGSDDVEIAVTVDVGAADVLG